MNKEELKDYTKIMADNVIDGETTSIQFEDAVWDAAKYSEENNVLSLTLPVTDTLQFVRRYIFSN